MPTKRMTCRAYIKSVNMADRTVEQIVSVFGNVDFAKDRVVYGAFAGSLDRWKTSGDPIPVIWSHTWDDPFAHIGAVLEAKELAPGDPLLPPEIADLGGLWTKYRLDEEPFAEQVLKLLNERRVREASFAYDVLDQARTKDGVNDLLELDLIEVGPTLKGMNPMTQLLARKALVAELASKMAAATTDEEAEQVLADLALKTVSHTFLPKDDDPTRCTVCDLTRNTAGHLNTLSTEADGAKAVVALAGSIEERQDALHAAGMDAIDLSAAAGGFYDLALEGTFEDRVVFRLEGWDDPYGGGVFYECAIESEGAEGVVLGDPVEVVVEGVTRPKSRMKRENARGSALKAEMLRTLGAAGKAKDKDEEPSGAKSEDPESRTGSTGEALRALVEIDELDLTAT